MSRGRAAEALVWSAVAVLVVAAGCAAIAGFDVKVADHEVTDTHGSTIPGAYRMLLAATALASAAAAVPTSRLRDLLPVPAAGSFAVVGIGTWGWLNLKRWAPPNLRTGGIQDTCPECAVSYVPDGWLPISITLAAIARIPVSAAAVRYLVCRSTYLACLCQAPGD
jgi:hypothetical protein